MSSDIKPGQVRRWNNVPDKSIVIDSVDGVKVRYHQEDGASFTTNAIHLGYGTTLYGWDVTPTDEATPAPLDPSKVRVGDTVTLEGKHGTTIRGPVENVEHDRAEAVIGFSLPGLGWRYLRDGVVAQQDTGVWTLTEHQPAPEPESEWRGKFISGATDDGVRVIGFVDEDDDFFGIEEGRRHLRGVLLENLTDVRPLVVIDPERARALVHDHFDDDRSRALLDALLDGAS